MHYCRSHDGALAAWTTAHGYIPGVIIIATATAIRGGSVRDILLGDYRLAGSIWEYAIVATAAVLTTIVAPVMPYLRKVFWCSMRSDWWSFLDHRGTGCTGYGHGPIIAVVAAVTTGVFGGVLREMSESHPTGIPEKLYAGVSFASAVLYIALQHDVLIIMTW
ncbi:TRIC cation channel family protein [Escherichia coli]